MKSLFKAFDIARGDFVPFLQAYWDAEERQIVECKEMPQLSKSSERLAQKILSRLPGANWHINLLNSGRSSIQLALESMQLPPHSKVALPSFSCVGVIQPIIQAGLEPVLADTNESFSLNLESLNELYTSDLRALIVPHLSGQWANDFERILSWAKERNVYVIEDATQALGLVKSGTPAGCSGDVGVFSTGLGKPIFGPGGGWLITKDPKLKSYLQRKILMKEPQTSVRERLFKFAENYDSPLAARGRSLIWNYVFQKPKVSASYRFEIFEISEHEAALALVQFEKLSEIIKARRENSLIWKNKLHFRYARKPPSEDHIFCKYLLWGDDSKAKKELQDFCKHLGNYRIEAELSYTPLHLREKFSHFKRANLSRTDLQWQNAFSVPVRPNLTSGEIERIEAALNEWNKC